MSMHTQTVSRARADVSLAHVITQRTDVQNPCKDKALLGALSIIAHDLRGPLANLSILMELIEAHVGLKAYDRAAGSAQKAQSMIAAMNGLLNGFLERVRETGDPLSFTPTLVDLAEVVRGAIDLNRPIAESRNIRFECSELRPYAVNGDYRLLTEAVDNLIGNAVKHAPEGSHVTCRIGVKGKAVTIEIGDRGPGLSEIELARAFRPFASLKSKRAPRGASFGLGLWIVRLIAERHGGRVEAKARRDGPGACFILHLPAHGL